MSNHHRLALYLFVVCIHIYIHTHVYGFWSMNGWMDGLVD